MGICAMEFRAICEVQRNLLSELPYIMGGEGSWKILGR